MPLHLVEICSLVDIVGHGPECIGLAWCCREAELGGFVRLGELIKHCKVCVGEVAVTVTVHVSEHLLEGRFGESNAQGVQDKLELGEAHLACLPDVKLPECIA